MKKQLLYYSAVFFVGFLLGIATDHYILQKTVTELPRKEQNLEIILQNEEAKIVEKTPGIEHGCTLYVDVSGAVVKPGVYCLESSSLVVDAVNMAGGFSKNAGHRFISRKINLSQPLVNNQKLYFPFETELICQLQPLLDESNKIGQMFNPPVTTLPTTEPYTDHDTPNSSDSNNNSSFSTQCVNINTATKEQLITLNGVGESTAEKIIQGRPYAQIEDILNVSGIGEATLDKFRLEICI